MTDTHPRSGGARRSSGSLFDGIQLVPQRLSLPGGGQLTVLQPDEAAELPDDGPVEWAPLVPYWAVLWRSGVALGRELAGRSGLEGMRVVELGCGLGVPSLVAARAGATVLATDAAPEALELAALNARENGLGIETALADWTAPDALIERAPFDLVLAADVLYERASVARLLELLPRLGDELWLADPGRSVAAAFFDQAPRLWPLHETTVRDGIEIHRLRARAEGGARLELRDRAEQQALEGGDD